MKYFTKEVKIALTAIVAIVLLYISINMLKGINVFKDTNTYYVEFPDIAGLAVSNAVYANGYPVGIVRDIQYDYSRTDRVVVCVELNKDMNVPKGTRAELESELMGGVKMSFILGPNPADNMKPGSTIQGGMHYGAMNKLEGMIPQLESILPKLDSIMGNLQRLTADPALAQTLANTAEITANLKESTASLNGMLKKDVPQLLHNMNHITGEVAKIDFDGTMKRFDSTMGSIEQVTSNLSSTTDFLHAKLQSRDNTLGLFLNDRSVYDNLSNTMGHADSLMIDLKAHPKRYVHFSIFGKKDK